MRVICRQQPVIHPEEKTEVSEQEEQIITCALCNHPITDPTKQIIVSQSFRHVFANPHGHVFEIGCFSEASGCIPGSACSTEFSWFAGYSWRIGACRACSNHLGWFFSSNEKHFWGLILEKLIFP